MKALILALCFATAAFASTARAEGYEEEMNALPETMEELFAQPVSDEELLQAEEENAGFEHSAYGRPNYYACVRQRGYSWCNAFFSGYDQSERDLRMLAHKFSSKREACRAHAQHYNRVVKFQHSVPYRKGYVYFGRRVADCE